MDCACPGSKMSVTIPADVKEKTLKHPCYSADAHQHYARMHLPVAPACNIQCNYCNRKFDCVHESRPGVTSEILSPEQAREKFLWVSEKIENLSVVGIAGPGDALANWEQTKQTIENIRNTSADTIFCLSTNGLMLPDFAPELVALGVHHVTVTCNAVDPVIGAQLYRYVSYQGKTLEGVDAARVLLANQLRGIEYLTKHGVMVKINIVMVKGINDQHIPTVVKKMKELGVFITNIMPLIPAPGSIFENLPQTSMKDINEMRNLCQLDVQQMRHCKQCRADAIGLLGEDRSQEFRMADRQGKTTAEDVEPAKSLLPVKIAVASKYGRLVDLHFGHASEFRIYQCINQQFSLVEVRSVDKYCMGMEECDSEEHRREAIVHALLDCAAVVTMRIGYHAKERLRKKGIRSFESCDSVENGIRYALGELAFQKAI